jgi:hypothetical protein
MLEVSACLQTGFQSQLMQFAHFEKSGWQFAILTRKPKTHLGRIILDLARHQASNESA